MKMAAPSIHAIYEVNTVVELTSLSLFIIRENHLNRYRDGCTDEQQSFHEVFQRIQKELIKRCDLDWVFHVRAILLCPLLQIDWHYSLVEVNSQTFCKAMNSYSGYRNISYLLVSLKGNRYPQRMFSDDMLPQLQPDRQQLPNETVDFT